MPYVYNAHKGWTLVEEAAPSYINTSKTGNINSPHVGQKNRLNYSPVFGEHPNIQKPSGPKTRNEHIPLSKDTAEDFIYSTYNALKNFKSEISTKPLSRDLPTIMGITAKINTFIRQNFNNKFSSKTPTTIPAALKNLYDSYRELTIQLAEKGANSAGALLRTITADMNKHIQNTSRTRSID